LRGRGLARTENLCETLILPAQISQPNSQGQSQQNQNVFSRATAPGLFFFIVQQVIEIARTGSGAWIDAQTAATPGRRRSLIQSQERRPADDWRFVRHRSRSSISDEILWRLGN
jgi:hypothetical protein